MNPSMDAREVETRLAELARRAQALEAEGLPFPTGQIELSVRQALDQNDTEQAAAVLRRGESLYAKASRDWTWVRELLRRTDEVRALAQSIGVDVAHLEARVGNARDQLKSAPLSGGSLEKAAASASLGLAVLSDAIPKFCVQEAKKLGVTIKMARDRGEEVAEATLAFRSLLDSVHDAHLPLVTSRLLDVRRAVARIPRAPAIATMPTDEEEEILLEARNLARRLHRIKGRARDAQSAAKLMSEVRAALSEDRRYGTPEEEIEALWTEVDRLTKERQHPTLSDIPEPDANPESALAPTEFRSSEVPTLVPPVLEELPRTIEPPMGVVDPPTEARRRARGARAARP